MVQSDTQQAETPSSQDGVEVAATKMDPALKAKWVTALRSGEYEQGQSRLRTLEGSFCCLGVLCEVAGVQISDGGNSVVGIEDGMDDYQPIYDLIGNSAIAAQLWRMNDGNNVGGKTFPEIADFIERHL